MARIIAYQVQDDGFFDPVAFKKENLKSAEVFIFVDDWRKELWIWIGEEADVRTRFISSTVAAEIRRLYGLTFRVRSADQGYEPSDFWKCLDLVPQSGIGPAKKSDLTELIPPKPPKFKSSKTKTSKTTTAKSSKKITKKRKKTSKTTTPLTEYTETKPSLVSTPSCPQCKKGHLLPYSQVINVTSRRKEVLPYAKWICSHCSFSPTKTTSL